MSTIDLSRPPEGHSYKIAVEREETVAERRVRLGKDIALFAVALGFVVVIFLLCVATLRSDGASVDEKKWAMSVLAAAAGGLVGYLVKK